MTKKSASTHSPPGKQEIEPLLLHQLPFLSLALAGANQRIPQNFMDGNLFSWKEIRKNRMIIKIL